jgi:hypothetical protein
MVKKYYLFFVIICLFSCSQPTKSYYLIKSNEDVVMKNYPLPNTFPPDISDLFEEINIDTFDTMDFMKGADRKKLNGVIFQYLLQEYQKSENEHFKNIIGDNLMEVKIDTLLHKIELLPIGKTYYKTGVISFIVLMKKFDSTKGNYNGYLILYNVKNNKLCSIIELSSHITGIDDDCTKKTYFMRGNFTQVKYTSSNNYIPQELLSILKIHSTYSEFLFYSQYTINQNGFIQFVK